MYLRSRPWIVYKMSRCVKYWEMIESGKALEAARELDKLLTEDPGYTGAYYNLGLAFKAMGMPNVAANYFHAYLDIDPDGYHRERTLNALKELGEVEEDA